VARFCQPMANKWQSLKFEPRLLKLGVKVYGKSWVDYCFYCKWLLAIRSLCLSNSVSYYIESNAKLLATKCKMQ
jgi:hypothetical protein